MQIINPNSKYDFVGKQKLFLLVSSLAVLASLALVAVMGINFGVDFRGGSEIVLRFDKPVAVDEVRASINAMGFESPDVQSFGAADENRFLVRVSRASVLNPENAKTLQDTLAREVAPIERFSWSEEGGDVVYIKFTTPLRDPNKSDDDTDLAKIKASASSLKLATFEVSRRGSESAPEYELVAQEVQSTLAAKLSESFKDAFNKESGVERVETVGPRVGKQLREDGIVSVLLSLLFILIYIAFRFDLRYAPGAVIALFHDIIITLGVFAALQIEFTLPIIAALLAIIGYSLNDTIVIFDRIRENFTQMANEKVETVVNTSINESLSRTLLTSLTTLIAVAALYIFGGGLVRSFALALIVGIIVGTYSSSFVASPIMIAMHKWLEKRRLEREKNQPPPPAEPQHPEPSPEDFAS